MALAGPLLPGCSRAEPKPPQNLTISPSGPRALTLLWQSGEGSEARYRVEQEQGTGFREVALLPATATRYEATGLGPKHTYRFRVVALGAKKGGPEPHAEGSGATLPLSLEEAVAGAKPSVVLVRNQRASLFGADTFGFGSGFVISGERVVTNHHVIDGATEVALRLDGTWYVAQVLASDATNDLAVLKTSHTLPPDLTLGDSDNASEGTALVALGFPKVDTLVAEGFDITCSIAPGVLTAFRQRTRSSESVFTGVPISVTCKLLQMNCPINPGNSGGPVLEIGTGQVVGVTASQLEGSEGIKFAVPVNHVKELAAREVTASFLRGLGGGSPGTRDLFRHDRPWPLGNSPLPFGNTPSSFRTSPSPFRGYSPFSNRP